MQIFLVYNVDMLSNSSHKKKKGNGHKGCMWVDVGCVWWCCAFWVQSEILVWAVQVV